MYGHEPTNFISITRDEQASRRAGLTVKHFTVGDKKVSSLVILQKKNSTHYAVEIGLGMEYMTGGWTVKKRLAYWDNSQIMFPEMRPQGFNHEGQEAMCMGTFHSAYNINDSLVSWFCSLEGRHATQVACLELAKAHALKVKLLQAELKGQNDLFALFEGVMPDE